MGSAPLSLRAYARHRGVSAPSVLRAISRGRLKESLVRNSKGKWQIGDVALADREWAANTDHSRAPGYVKERGTAPAAAAPTVTDPVTPPPVTPPTSDAAAPAGASKISPLAEASAREKNAKAAQAELELKVALKQYVSAAKVEERLVEVFARLRTKLLGIPSKTKSALPNLTHAELLVIDRLIREALEELASPADIANGSAA